MQTTSIVIPNANGLSFLQECLYSIKQHTRTPYEIIVVDNGSQDGSLELCIREKVRFISVPFNRGFPAACNLGMSLASGDAILLLNNDTIVAENWLDNMLRCLYSQEEIGIVGPMTNYASGKQMIQQPFTTLADMAARMNQPNPAKWVEVQRIVGLCFFVQKGAARTGRLHG